MSEDAEAELIRFYLTGKSWSLCRSDTPFTLSALGESGTAEMPFTPAAVQSDQSERESRLPAVCRLILRVKSLHSGFTSKVSDKSEDD